MRHALLTLAQVLGLIMLADFVSGIVHWLEDAYGSEDTPVVGPLFIRPNIVHHHYPRHFTRLTWWQSSWDLVLVGATVLGLAWWFDLLSWQLAVFVVVSANANQVHKWSHRTRTENGPIVSFFQDIRVLQTPRQHAVHHTDPKNTYYCPVTNLVNPALERIQFWPRLEAIIERVTGIRHREDTSVRGQGPGPEWLADFRPASAKSRPTTTPALVAAQQTPPVHPTATAAVVRISSTPALTANRVSCDCRNCPTQATCPHHGTPSHSTKSLAA